MNSVNVMSVNKFSISELLVSLPPVFHQRLALNLRSAMENQTGGQCFRVFPGGNAPRQETLPPLLPDRHHHLHPCERLLPVRVVSAHQAENDLGVYLFHLALTDLTFTFGLSLWMDFLWKSIAPHQLLHQ